MNDLTRDSERLIQEARIVRDDNRAGGRHRRSASIGQGSKRLKQTNWVKRIRNVLIAIGNSGEMALAEAAKPLLDDTSALVRGAAVWALSQLLPAKELVPLRKEDPDPDVSEEWRLALM